MLISVNNINIYKRIYLKITFRLGTKIHRKIDKAMKCIKEKLFILNIYLYSL